MLFLMIESITGLLYMDLFSRTELVEVRWLIQALMHFDRLTLRQAQCDHGVLRQVL